MHLVALPNMFFIPPAQRPLDEMSIDFSLSQPAHRRRHRESNADLSWPLLGSFDCTERGRNRTGMAKTVLSAEALEFTINALAATREKLDVFLSKVPPEALRDARAELSAE